MSTKPLYMVSMRGFQPRFYEDRDEAEWLFSYCRRYFSGVSFVVTDWRRIHKNLYTRRYA